MKILSLARKGKGTHHAVVEIMKQPSKGDGIRRTGRLAAKARKQRKYIDASWSRFFGADIVCAIAVAKMQHIGAAAVASELD